MATKSHDGFCTFQSFLEVCLIETFMQEVKSLSQFHEKTSSLHADQVKYKQTSPNRQEITLSNTRKENLCQRRRLANKK